LTLPKEGTKSGVAHEIPLSDAVVEIIEGLPRVEGKGGFVFTTTGKTAVSGFCKAKAKVDAAILKAIRQEAEARGPAVEALPHWTLYDLRRTVATSLQKLGVRLEVT
jgi:integrase